MRVWLLLYVITLIGAGDALPTFTPLLLAAATLLLLSSNMPA